jgi:predicted small lipoprotein YifL
VTCARHLRFPRVSLAVVSLLILAGCGKKGPPLAPLRPQPAPVEALQVARLADRARISFTLPSKNADGTLPADLDSVEVYALTGRPLGPDNRPLDVREWMRFGTPVGRVDVEPPPPPPPDEDEEGAPPPPPPPHDPRPAQGERVQIEEMLGPGAKTVFVHPHASPAENRPDVVSTSESPLGNALGWLQGSGVVERHYIAIGVSSSGRVGPPSQTVAVPLVDPPPPPPPPDVSYTATAVVVKWEAPAGLRRPIQPTVSPERQNEGWLPVRAPLSGPSPHTFTVYELDSAKAPATSARPVNAAPLAAATFEDPRVTFGVERCYAVRTVQAYRGGTLESALSPATCVTLRDIFPPAAPTNLASVGSEGGVSLIWEASAEDVAGYHVLRGLVGGALAQVTSALVRETTWRDTTAQPGVRYAYAVVAVDAAGNVSTESNRVEDEAR